MYMARARCVHSLYTAVGGRVQTVHGRPRPCTNCVHGRTRAMHMVRPSPEHGRVRSRYVAKQGRVRGPYPTVYVPYTWPCTGRVLPCTVYTAVYTAVFTSRVHGRVRTMYTAVHGPSMTRTRPCTRSCTLYTAVFTARVRGRVPCTCTCLWPVYTAVHGQTAVYRLRTGHVHDPIMTRTRRRPPHCRVYSPCRVLGRSRRVRTVYTTTRCIPCIAKVDNRNLLDGY